MTNPTKLEIAKLLNHAETSCTEVEQISVTYPDMTVEEGYDIQHMIMSLKEDAGQKIIGWKMGLTSVAKMEQMKVKEPIYGCLMDYMMAHDGDQVDMADFIHPRVETEVAFVLKDKLFGEDVTEEDVINATEYVVPAMEIIDSRYKNFSFSLADVVADNGSSVRFILGSEKIDPKTVDLGETFAKLIINDKEEDTGYGKAILGHPATSICMLVKMLSKRGIALEAGHVVMAGAMTKAFYLKAGDKVRSEFDTLGNLAFTVKD